MKSAVSKHPSFLVTQVLSKLESLPLFISALVLGMLELILLFTVGPGFEQVRPIYSASFASYFDHV